MLQTPDSMSNIPERNHSSIGPPDLKLSPISGGEPLPTPIVKMELPVIDIFSQGMLFAEVDFAFCHDDRILSFAQPGDMTMDPSWRSSQRFDFLNFEGREPEAVYGCLFLISLFRIPQASNDHDDIAS